MQSFVEARGGTITNFLPIGTDPVAVVRLSWTKRDLPAEARYNVVVTDPTGEQADVLVYLGPANGRISLGWDGRFSVLPDRYPFLAGAHAVQMAGGELDPMAVEFRPNFDGPLWLVARFPRNGAISVVRRSDVPSVGVFLTGADERIWWAEQLTKGSSALTGPS